MLRFLDISPSLSAGIQKRLRRKSISSENSGVDQLIYLAKYFSRDLKVQESPSKWARLVWAVFVGYFASMIPIRLPVTANDTYQLPFSGSVLPLDLCLLSNLIDQVCAHLDWDPGSRDEFQ